MTTVTSDDAKKNLDELILAVQGHAPQVISQQGKELAVLISLEDYLSLTKKSKLDNLPKRPECVIGDPEDLVSMDWSKEWNRDLP